MASNDKPGHVILEAASQTFLRERGYIRTNLRRNNQSDQEDQRGLISYMVSSKEDLWLKMPYAYAGKSREQRSPPI